MSTKEIGSFGERIAEKYLKNKGYQILDKNYCFRIPGNPQKGEIDIIAKNEDIIHFVEVKSIRGPSSVISPEEKVNWLKKKKIIKAAESWLMKKKLSLNSKWQIDVISIKINRDKAKIKHFENI